MTEDRGLLLLPFIRGCRAEGEWLGRSTMGMPILTSYLFSRCANVTRTRCKVNGGFRRWRDVTSDAHFGILNVMKTAGSSPLQRGFLRAVRFYTYNTPVAKGKYRMQSMALGLCRSLPERMEARTKDGRYFYANLASGLETSLYF